MQVGQIIEVVRLRPGLTKVPFRAQIVETTITGFQARPMDDNAPTIGKIDFNRIGISTDGQFKVNEGINFTTG